MDEDTCRLCGARALADVGVVRGYPFRECACCGFVLTPAVRQAAMEELYAGDYHGPLDGAPATGWFDDTGFLDPAFARLPKRTPLTILDFGTGQSLIPDSLRARGHRVVAVDVAPPLRPHPDRLTGRLEDLDLAPSSFDIVFSFQVVEHLPEPRPVLDRLLALTRPCGIMLTHTDMDVPERGPVLADWWYVTPPDHCCFFRPRTFERLVEGTPHRLVWWDAKTAVIRAGERV